MASKWNDPIHNFYDHVFLTTDCWLWTGAIDKNGYGISAIKQRKISAHRVSYLLHYGEIPPNLYVLHTCHNPSCVNPNHLKIGTQKDNIQDQINIGTHVGKNRSAAKLTENDVQYIRTSSKSYIDIAKELSVSKHCIWDVLNYRSWKHVRS